MSYDVTNRRLYIDKTDPDNPKGITLQEVSRCLRDYRKNKNGEIDLGMMCSSPKIDMWAKFKPIRGSFMAYPQNWWKGSDGWCGLSIAEAKISGTTDVSAIADHYTQDRRNGWSYLQPRGSQYNELFRLSDFDGYNHMVTSFVNGYTMPGKCAKTEGQFNATFRITMGGEESADYLSYTDLPLENYYLGIALIGGGKVYRCTNSKTIEESGFNVEFPISAIESGEYAAYPFFSDVKMSVTDGGFFPANVYTLPDCGASAIVIVDKELVIMIEGYLTSEPNAEGMYACTYTAKITNNVEYDIEVTNNYIQLRRGNASFYDTMFSDEKSKELDSPISIKAGKTHTIRGLFDNIVPSLADNCKFWVSLQSSYYLQNASPQQNIRPDA